MQADKKSLVSTEGIARSVLFALGILNIGFVLMICTYLVAAGLPGIIEIGFLDFTLGTEWASTASEPKFGILPFILTSIYGTAGAIVLGLPLGLFTAIFLARFAPRRLRLTLEPMVDLLAGIPSVVYGFVGMLVLVPAIQWAFSLPDGAGLLASIIVLAVMILPSIIKVSVNAIEAVPKEYELASLALGANEVETTFKVIVPAARSGIAAAVVLGVGRAIGEAMAVMMVSGNAANLPGLFESVRFLTTAVASEMSYSSGLQREALFSIALVLFCFIMAINAALNLCFKQGRK
ncbi:MAG: phosphate ABC transporter permease subunit PstC [Succinivibrionaceae bacterium]|nr:phosphate ABC transporter permease subunit PstC [Succinivibrionaceae bacterium]